MDHRQLLSQQTHAFSSPALRQITIEVQRINGVNLGQGTCQLPAPDYVLQWADISARGGNNRYTNPRGLLSFREALAKKLAHHNGIEGLDPESEILITCGATGAFEAVCAVLLDPGDEVVVFEPYYPYHIQALKRYGAKITYVPLRGNGFQFDPDELRRAVNEKTKFMLVNTPGNPTGKVLSKDELETIAGILEPYRALLVTDEIYEYMVFDGARHISPASLPSLRDRTITMGGYSKTFSITGWRIGYCVVPAAIAPEMASVLDAIYVCAPAPLQEAVAQGINHFGDDFYEELCAKYKHKRDLFAAGLTEIGLEPVVPNGAYYMICRFDKLFPGLTSWEFVRRMIASSGVGGVPSDDFVRDSSVAPWVRFCLAVDDSVLETALERLHALSKAGV
jgi:aminotransferase